MAELSADLVTTARGELIPMKPRVLHFPMMKPFMIGDTFNGPVRGVWWFMDNAKNIQGPYTSEGETGVAIMNWQAANIRPTHGGYPDEPPRSA